MYYIACCGNDGKCFGFLRNDKTVSENPDSEIDKLMKFKKKEDANELILQWNIGHILLPNGSNFRITAVKG